MSHVPGFPILLQHAYTEAEWAADNPVLMERETGWTTDTRRVKLGDGVTAWNDLPWAADEAASVAAETARAEAAEAAIAGNLTTETNSRIAGDAANAADILERTKTLFYGHDIANTATALGVGVLTALPLTYSIPPSDIDVSVEWGGLITVTTAGSGAVIIGPCDVSSGAPPTGFLSYAASLAGSFTSGAWGQAPSFKGSVNLGPSTLWRTIRLYGFVGRDATLAASNRASGANPPSTKTWLRVFTG